ncbi:hypothetical protein [Streptomyces djakartensis]|uniref:hypothetical protein n=1 Tax=Streptomyces djakartensis TaxID=68193 RepID=UPI0034DED602
MSLRSRLSIATAGGRAGDRTDFGGDVVRIPCRTGGRSVQGNPRRCLLTDGTRAWGAARCIDTIGPAPRWC